MTLGVRVKPDRESWERRVIVRDLDLSHELGFFSTYVQPPTCACITDEALGF